MSYVIRSRFALTITMNRTVNRALRTSYKWYLLLLNRRSILMIGIRKEENDVMSYYNPLRVFSFSYY